MREVYVQGGPIPLGRQGENQAQAVIWQGIAAQYAALYGEGAFQLMVARCGDAAPYPVALTRDGSSLVWTVSDSDTAKSGVGRCELTYLVGGAVAKSKTWQTQVLASFTADGSAEPPEPAQSWVQEVLEAAAAAGKSAAAAADSADKAEDASVHAPQIGADGAWETWDQATGAYVPTGVEAQGAKGEKGDQGATGPQGEQGPTGPQGPKGDDGSGAIPDWTQNDETAADYVKNRPGGYDVYSSELAATGSFAPAGSGLPIAAVDFPDKFIVDGQKVTVKIENETFERTVQKVPDDKKVDPDSLAEYWIRLADGEGIQIGDNGWMFFFQLNSAGTWGKSTVASGTYLGKAFEVYAEVATPVQFPAKYVNTKFIVTCTIEKDSNNDFIVSNPSHTFDEISAAYLSGADVVLKTPINENVYTFLELQVAQVDAVFQWGGMVDTIMAFVTVQKDGSTDSWLAGTVNLVIQDQLSEIRQLPESSGADDGKFLRVVNGAPTWEAVSDTTIKLKSSTAGSTKYFNITVNDDGQITATEVT